ncbi:unnamed protein product (macronuclear) [Paramecium tetraurelia]|uniref:RING-type domain-containing protein n=1 Tax=Paramecium tetraurelia TaxID=5888 RepID=A0C4D4_PARTE|nr:uncharacterized protein GSPATT00035131001 [Paramecium tetraurelia]CAK65651.1 unnamed protein product [Paramecium tetraurelia]|eukprot:XP_001433048.1 hypothetical protein (macronuclear) [Paramecium tetraurelia strain d4-2]
MDAMESLINELKNPPFKSTMDFPKQSSIKIMKSQSAKTVSTRAPKITEIIYDQKQNLLEQSLNFQKAENSQYIDADKNKIVIEPKQIQSIYQPVKYTSSLSLGSQLKQQNIQQDKNLKINQFQYRQCDVCKDRGFDIIETPCNHFFDKKCLNTQFNQQFLNYDHQQKFYCICKKELYSNFYIKHLELNGEKLFQKQIKIIFQKYQKMFQQCKQCQTFWIFDIYKKTNDSCFKCGSIYYP